MGLRGLVHDRRTPGSGRLDFIDWIKAIGIVLIVYGHVAGSTINFLTPPILPKQIGVACFLLVLAFVLARERRAVVTVLVNRLFTVYLVGVGFALLLTAWGALTTGDLQLSNYLPFLFGANVLLLQNAFPANPTTWYIGTYVHVLVLWAVFGRQIYVRIWMLGSVALGEITVRILLADAAGPFVAYTALSNWLTVLLWGTWLGQQPKAELRRSPSRIALSGFILVLLVLGWPIVGSGLGAYGGFPFEGIGNHAPITIAIIASAMVTILYVAYADCIFSLTGALRAPGIVQFLARNTLLIFIGHMPVFYLIGPFLEPRLSFWTAKGIELLICLGGIGALSEAIFRYFDITALRDGLFSAARDFKPAEQKP